MVLQAMGDLAGARPLLEQALDGFRRVLGEGHPDTAVSYGNLGLLLQAMGDLAGARPLLERALAISASRSPGLKGPGAICSPTSRARPSPGCVC
jgi:hypothetical protein